MNRPPRSRGSLLIVDDDQELLELLQAGLSADGFEVVCSGLAEHALEILDHGNLDVVISDINLPGMSGIDFCARVSADHPNLPVIVMTAFSSIKTAVSALRAGAYDYLVKPVDLEALSARLDRVFGELRTRREVERLRGVVLGEAGFGGLIGSSSPMKRMFELMDRAASTDASVLVTGESGTGKELVANALHRRSARVDGPFVPVNCSAIPEQLLESELFGHAKGAFTDAKASRMGLFQEADGGTLFLDEIGEVPLAMQAKLLRALEERRIRPVGSNDEVSVDLRFIAATNRDLELAVEEGRYREDLFFRVNVIHIHVPPLRSRGADVLTLAQHFLARYAVEFGKPVVGLTVHAAERLMNYGWPGNVRELRNSMERAVALTGNREIAVADLPERVRQTSRTQLVVGSEDPVELLSMEQVEKRYILHVMEVVRGNKSMAAKILGLDRKTLYRKLQRFEAAAARGQE